MWEERRADVSFLWSPHLSTLDRLFQTNAMFTLPANQVADNPLYYAHGSRALPASVLINLLVMELDGGIVTSSVAGADKATSVEEPIHVTPVASPSSFVTQRDAVFEDTLVQAKLRAEAADPLREDSAPMGEILLPYEDKMDAILQSVAEVPAISRLTVAESSLDHPLHEFYSDAIENEETLLNFRAISFVLQADPPPAGPSGGRGDPSHSGTFGTRDQTRYNGPVYGGEPVTVYAVVTIGEYKLPYNLLEQYNDRHQAGFFRGPIVTGDVGQIGETGDRVYIHIADTLFAGDLARELPFVQDFKARKKRERADRSEELKQRYAKQRAMGIDPDSEAWVTGKTDTDKRLNAMESDMSDIKALLMKLAGGAQ